MNCATSKAAFGALAAITNSLHRRRLQGKCSTPRNAGMKLHARWIAAERSAVRFCESGSRLSARPWIKREIADAVVLEVMHGRQYTIAAIAERYGMDRSNVYRLMTKYGQGTRGGSKRLGKSLQSKRPKLPDVGTDQLLQERRRGHLEECPSRTWITPIGGSG